MPTLFRAATPLFLVLTLFLSFGVLEPLARAQSQHEMNAEAAAEFRKADAALNRVYKKLMVKIDEDAQENLRAAQRAWIAFRDAQAELEAGLGGEGGSIYPMLLAGAKAELTKARTEALEQLLSDYSEE